MHSKTDLFHAYFESVAFDQRVCRDKADLAAT